MPSFVSCAKVQNLLKKNCVAWIVVVVRGETNNVDMNKVSIMNEFLDVFLEELLGLSPDQEVEFTNDFLLGIELVSISSYRMAPVELK